MSRTLRFEPIKWLKEHLDYAGDDCLTWPFAKNDGGYGRIQVDGKIRIVSRVVCEHHNGEPPTPKHDAAHSCGNGHLGCVTPKHISWKTRKENMADTLIHGTRIRGESQHLSKLTPDQVLEIRNSTIGPLGLSRIYGTTPSNIAFIKTRKTWTWL